MAFQGVQPLGSLLVGWRATSGPRTRCCCKARQGWRFGKRAARQQ